MATRDNKPQQDTPQRNIRTDLPKTLIEQTLNTFDDHSEVVALHRWVYDALYAQMTSELGYDAKDHAFGLYLLFRWLKERDQTAKDNLKQLCEQIRRLSSADTIEEPWAEYCYIIK